MQDKECACVGHVQAALESLEENNRCFMAHTEEPELDRSSRYSTVKSKVPSESLQVHSGTLYRFSVG